MITRTLTVVAQDPCGLHMRPAAQVAQTLSRHGVQARVQLGSLDVDGTSILALLLLSAKQGSVLTVRVTGTRADEAIQALRQLFVAPRPLNGGRADGPPPDIQTMACSSDRVTEG